MRSRPITLALLLLTGGCWRHSSGSGEEHQLTFEGPSGGTSVQLRAGRPGEASGPGYPVGVRWLEARQNPLAAGLHGGGGWEYRAVPLDVRDAHCEPATLCDVTVQPAALGTTLLLRGRTLGRGELVVRAKVSWWRSVSDRLPVTVLPPR
jgi:hypothetical protein